MPSIAGDHCDLDATIAAIAPTLRSRCDHFARVAASTMAISPGVRS